MGPIGRKTYYADPFIVQEVLRESEKRVLRPRNPLPPSPKGPIKQFTIDNIFQYTCSVIRMKAKARPTGSKAEERTHRTTGINLPTETWELLRRVAFERTRRSGGRGSVSALLVQLVERHKRELEKELASASR